MALDTKALRETRARLAGEAGEILTIAARDGREQLRADEEEKWEAIHKDIERISKHIDMREKQSEEERRLEESPGRKTDPADPDGPAVEHRNTTGNSGSAMRRLRMGQQDSEEALRSWLLAGSPAGSSLTSEHRAAAQRAGVDLGSRNITIRLSSRALKDVRQLPEWEARAQTVTTTGGGYVVPDDTMRAIEVALLAFGGMRAVSTVIRTDSGADLPIPTSDDTSNKGAILGINTQVTGLDITFGQVVLNAYKYTSRLILVPVELLQDAAINVPEFIGARLGERIGRITNDHFTTGTGSGQPNGVVTAATLGKTGITGQTTSIIYNDIVDLEHSVNSAYRVNARWMMSDAMLKALKKLIDGDSRPLWQPGLAGLAQNPPNTLMGYPYTVNDSMAVPAASAKSLLFGDFSKYLIRDVVGVDLLRLDERYADYHQVGFLAFSRHDGDLIDAGTNPIKYYAHPAA